MASRLKRDVEKPGRRHRRLPVKLQSRKPPVTYPKRRRWGRRHGHASGYAEELEGRSGARAWAPRQAALGVGRHDDGQRLVSEGTTAGGAWCEEARRSAALDVRRCTHRI
jgi:hypothetical protein